MKKSELKARIKELEVENQVLQILAAQHPMYVYIYKYLPYNPYWQPYRYDRWYIGDVTTETDSIGINPNKGGWIPVGTTSIGDTTKYAVGIDWSDSSDMTVTSTGYTVVN